MKYDYPKKLIAAAENDDYVLISDIISECSKKGLEFDLTVDEKIEWNDLEWDAINLIKIASVTVNHTFTLGDEVLAEWTSLYRGDYFNDWCIFEIQSDISTEIETLLEVVGIGISDPKVLGQNKLVDGGEDESLSQMTVIEFPNRTVMMQKKTITREGKLYYSLTTAAKTLGITSVTLNKLISSEGLEWSNFRENGPIWISVQSIKAYRGRQSAQKTLDSKNLSL